MEAGSREVVTSLGSAGRGAPPCGALGRPRAPRPRAAVVLLAASLVASVVAGLRAAPAGATTHPQGVDVSSTSGAINWGDVAHAGYSFAYAKATQGDYASDAEFQANWSGMVAAKVTPGAYLTVDPAVSGYQQATYFFQLVGHAYRAGDLVPAVDTTFIEEDLEPTCSSSRPPVTCVTQAAARSVLRVVVATLRSEFGTAPVIYTDTALWDGLLGDPTGYGADPLWDVAIGSTPPASTSLPAGNWYGDGWALWQYSLSGTVPGISGGTDLDESNGAPPTLAKLPVVIATTSLPGGQVGRPYTCDLTAFGGSPPYTWRLAKGSHKLPKGLKLSKAGRLAGTPTRSGTSSFTVEAVDAKSHTARRQLTLAVLPS